MNISIDLSQISIPVQIPYSSPGNVIRGANVKIDMQLLAVACGNALIKCHGYEALSKKLIAIFQNNKQTIRIYLGWTVIAK